MGNLNDFKKDDAEDFGDENDYQNLELHAKKSEGFKQIDPGFYKGRCVTLLQLGTQEDTKFGGDPKEKLILGWELPEELTVYDESKGAQPGYIQEFYTMRINKKSKFTKHVQGWLGHEIDEDFNIFSLIGKPAWLVIEQNTDDPKNPQSFVEAIKPLKDDCPARMNPLKILCFERWNQAVFNKLSTGIQKLIEDSPEYNALFPKYAEDTKEGKYRKTSDEKL